MRRISYTFALALSLWATCSVKAETTSNPLSFRPVDAEYSAALRSIIMISANPNQLHVYDPVNHTDQPVALAAAPLKLSVGPDGLYAAVTTDQHVSYIDLQAHSVLKTWTTAQGPFNVVLSASYIYLLPTYVDSPSSINLATGVATTMGGFIYDSGGRLDPAGNAIYGDDDGISPEGLVKFDVSGGVIGSGTTVGPFNLYPICGKIWFSPDATRIYNGCGTVARSSTKST